MDEDLMIENRVQIKKGEPVGSNPRCLNSAVLFGVRLNHSAALTLRESDVK